jgi:hypothetical protein
MGRHELRVAEDDGQDVVEIVGDAARKLADRLQGELVVSLEICFSMKVPSGKLHVASAPSGLTSRVMDVKTGLQPRRQVPRNACGSLGSRAAGNSSICQVVHLSAECWPFARTGGLGAAVRGLASAQAAAGGHAAVIIPLYHAVRERTPSETGFLFDDHTPAALQRIVHEVTRRYADRHAWGNAVRQAMGNSSAGTSEPPASRNTVERSGPLRGAPRSTRWSRKARR